MISVALLLFRGVGLALLGCKTVAELSQIPTGCHLDIVVLTSLWWCQKSFLHSGYLEKNTRTPTGKRPYKCQFCSKSFAESGHLKRHMRTHTGERPFICQLCEKSFSQDINFKIHIRTHTGEKT